MKMRGIIEINLGNRPDGTPVMELQARDQAGRQTLTTLEKALGVVRLLALTRGKADIHNVCGSSGSVTPDERDSLVISLALGGIELAPPKRPKR